MPRRRFPVPLPLPGLARPALLLVALAGSTPIADGGGAAVDGQAPAAPDEPAVQLVGTWLDTAAEKPGEPIEIGEDELGLWIEWSGTTARLERIPDIAEVHDVEPPGEARPPVVLRIKYALAILDDGPTERHVRLEDSDGTLFVDVTTVSKDGSAAPLRRPREVYAHRDDILPNGYTIFFANASEACLRKAGVNFNAAVAGPHVAELGNSGIAIFGRIDPKPGLPPHPDHAPGFFVIDSATDRATTGLDREAWLAALGALGVDRPRLFLPRRKWPKAF